ncbi:MAG: hypothetical protein M1817_000651 [Caeruleum heppii]|nr:MAG: hypothetical protein M1817_000651 [Caeruleum heppii]
MTFTEEPDSLPFKDGNDPSDPFDQHVAEDKGHNTDPLRDTTAVHYVTTRALDFLSDANNETIGACLVGLAAVTYFVLGRIGLLIIGLVGGIVLHAAWEGHGNDAAQSGLEAKAIEIRRRREVGLDVSRRALDWRERRTATEVGQAPGGEAGHVKGPSKSIVDFSGLAPDTAAALTSFTDAIIRDYVKWWYTPILPADNLFPEASRQTLVRFFLAISNHLSRKRPADTFLDFVTNSSSILIVFLNELSTALAVSSTPSDPSVAIQAYLEINPDSSLANVLDPHQQQKKLNVVAEDILHRFLDRAAYACEPARVFLREVLAGLVLDMTVQSCSRPEWINGWIVHALEGQEPELLNAIDAGMNGTTNGPVPGDGAGEAPSAGGLTPKGQTTIDAGKQHKRRVSKAELAMEEAMLEAKRLNEMIAEEEVKRKSNGANPQSTAQQISTSRTATETALLPDDVEADGGSIEMPSMESSRMSPSQSGGSSLTSATSLGSNFTSFDQLVPTRTPTALQTVPDEAPASPQSSHFSPAPSQASPLTLHQANISIFDDSTPTEKGKIRAKPSVDYLLQIEPASSAYPGWMIARKYSDFETLHEVLRRISVISGVTGFTQQHPTLPSWKGQTKSGLREQLEGYIHTALQYRPLAESEGMKRFLEKDQANGRASPGTGKGGFPGIGWPNPAAFETMGKGMLDVLASAPKGAAGGGKALLGGVTGVLGVGKKNAEGGNTGFSRSGTSSSLSLDRSGSVHSVEGRLSYDPECSRGVDLALSTSHATSPRPSMNGSSQRGLTREESTNSASSHRLEDAGELHLPPPPSDIPDDYGPSIAPPSALRSSVESLQSHPPNTATAVRHHTTEASTSAPPPTTTPGNTQALSDSKVSTARSTALPDPLTEQETRITVELMFAIVTELYTLSSAWNIRRTLLNAAKTYLLRPGNPNLEAIRVLIQDSLLRAYTSDQGIAGMISRVEKNTLPTEEELKAWPKPASEEEKERLRVKARKLLVEKGMPKALSGVMGAAASGEALGRVFDVLQEEGVARGLVFGLVLQGVRAVVQ